jgi:hypothetical protein
MRKKIIPALIAAVFINCIFSCKKPAGPGGQASVSGKVYTNDFDNTFSYLLTKGYRAGEKVYIIYGDNTSIGNKMETSPDGVFEFKYLTKGHYKVYANSVDTSVKVKGNSASFSVMREFDITDQKQKVQLDDIVINK